LYSCFRALWYSLFNAFIVGPFVCSALHVNTFKHHLIYPIFTTLWSSHLLSPSYRWRNSSLKKWSNLPKVPQLVGRRAQICWQVCLIPKLIPFISIWI
jgi:hypothetical protein